MKYQVQYMIHEIHADCRYLKLQYSILVPVNTQEARNVVLLEKFL